jgi:hypothetical protein
LKHPRAAADVAAKEVEVEVPEVAEAEVAAVVAVRSPTNSEPSED